MDYEEEWYELKKLITKNIKLCDQEAWKCLERDDEDFSYNEITNEAERLKQEAINLRMILNYMNGRDRRYGSIALESIYI